MIDGTFQALPVRDPKSIEPIRFKLLGKVRWEDEISETVIIPEVVKNKHNMDIRKGHLVKLVKIGRLAKAQFEHDLYDINLGNYLVIDPSINLLSPERSFRDGKDTYVLFDAGDVWAKGE